jgi:hypothetical protein
MVLHTSSLLHLLHSTNKCHYVLVFTRALHLLPALFFRVTFEYADLFTQMCIKFSYHVFHYTFLQILTQLQHLQHCVYTNAVIK